MNGTQKDSVYIATSKKMCTEQTRQAFDRDKYMIHTTHTHRGYKNGSKNGNSVEQRTKGLDPTRKEWERERVREKGWLQRRNRQWTAKADRQT